MWHDLAMRPPAERHADDDRHDAAAAPPPDDPCEAMPPVVLTVAASDPLGGAGMQADLATFAAFGVHGTSAITAVMAQSLTAVTAVAPMGAAMVEAQVRSVASTAGFEPSAAKTGLLFRPDTVDLAAALIDEGVLPAPVVDPVMVNGRGEPIVEPAVEAAYRERLIPRARVITPNRAEAELLAGTDFADAVEVLGKADALRALGAAAVVVTGGGFEGPPDDVVITPDDAWAAPGRRVRTANVRGSGCTFSAALACGLALGRGLEAAVSASGRFVRAAIEASAGWPVDGTGPVAHTLRAHPGG